MSQIHQVASEELGGQAFQISGDLQTDKWEE